MSSVYNSEPPTNGSVTLHTTHGPLDIRLWSAEAPLATRNFVQHCLDGTYLGLPFHRILPSLLIQTGDPTGRGDGGNAALPPYDSLPAHRNTRVRFRRRGLVAFVADQPSHTFRSQFFITLGTADWLDEEAHPIFGYVFGDTVYNALTLAAHGPVEDPNLDSVPRVTAISIVQSPFPELKPRPRQSPALEQPTTNRKPSAKRAVRADRLLSFRDSKSESDDDDDDDFKQAVPPLRNKLNINKRHMRPSQLRPNGALADHTPSSVHGAVNKRTTHTGTDAIKPSSDSRKDVIRKANDEFERLKAELLGEAPQPEAPSSSLPPVDAKSTEEQTPARAKEKPEVTQNVAGGSGLNDGLRRRRPQRVDETDTLHRLKAFEGRIVARRRKADGRNAPRGSAWYQSALQLPVVDEVDYEVVDGLPHGERIRRGR